MPTNKTEQAASGTQGHVASTDGLGLYPKLPDDLHGALTPAQMGVLAVWAAEYAAACVTAERERCTRGPGFQAPTYQPMPPAPGCAPLKQLTEDDVRRIVRDELERAGLVTRPVLD